MNTPLPPSSLRAVQVILGLVLAPLGASAANPEPSPAAKTQVLFMGADIDLEKDKEFLRVQDVTATALVVRAAGKPLSVPQWQGTNLRIMEALKLAGTSVALDNLKYERAYTPEADPFTQISKTAAQAAGDTALNDVAQYKVMLASRGTVGTGAALAMVKGTPNEGQFAAAHAEAEGLQAAEEAKMLQGHDAMQSEIYNVGSRSVAANNESGRELFDAIRFSFDVTADRDLNHPYYAFIALIREPGSKPGQVRKWAYVKSMNPIKSGETGKVVVYQGGLPPGYLLENCDVHVYNNGEELATSLSRKRVPLSDEEAMQYRVIEHISANKGRTLPAVLATPTFGGPERFSLTKAQLDLTCYVRVAKDGRVAAVFSDAEGKKPVQDAALESVLKALRFKPALDAGKPVESIARVNLGELPTL